MRMYPLSICRHRSPMTTRTLPHPSLHRLATHRAKWPHSSRGHITVSMLWGNTAYCVKLSDEDLSRYSNKMESVGLRKRPYYQYLTKKVMSQRHGGKTAGIDMVWRTYVTVTLCIPDAEAAAKMSKSNAQFSPTQLRSPKLRIWIFFIAHFSGPDRAVGPFCGCLGIE